MTTTKWTPKPKDTGTFSVWLCLPCGMFAISHRWAGSYDAETDPRDIQVRARKRKYLDRLRREFLPELGKDVGRDGKGTDYGHRAYCTADQLARAMARMALKIDSPGFKDHAYDGDLHDAYMAMWSAAVKLDDASPYNKAWTWHKPGLNYKGGHWQNCEKFGSHWFSEPDDHQGTSTCIDCGAVRAITGKKVSYAYPLGSVALHTPSGTKLDKPYHVPGKAA